MKTISFVHACPVEVQSPGPMGTLFPCEADVLVTYEAGRGRDEFFSVEDYEVCKEGHMIPEVVAVDWYTQDANEYGERLQSQYEDMEYYHRSGGL